MKAIDNYEKMTWLCTLLGGMYQDARIECDRLHKEFDTDEYVWYLPSNVYDFIAADILWYAPSVRTCALRAYGIRAERVYAQKGIVLMRVVSKHEEELTWI